LANGQDHQGRSHRSNPCCRTFEADQFRNQFCFRSRLPSLTGLIFVAMAGGGSISAILRRQSASVSCGPETNVPLTFVLYHPDSTPSRSDSSILTWRGERFCIEDRFLVGARPSNAVGFSVYWRSRVLLSYRWRAGQSPQVRLRPGRDDGCRLDRARLRINSARSAPSRPPPLRKLPESIEGPLRARPALA